jgi:hypothetical protein
MLSRPDVGTKEHIVSWLAAKDEAATYEWLSGQCPAGQYSEEFGDEHVGLNLSWLNTLAFDRPYTWGSLLDRAERAL